jgi:hypothetical protein
MKETRQGTLVPTCLQTIYSARRIKKERDAQSPIFPTIKEGMSARWIAHDKYAMQLSRQLFISSL